MTAARFTLAILSFVLVTGADAPAALTKVNSTSGRYVGASSGDRLSQAIRLAALPRMPYELRDSTGRLVAPGQPIEQKVTIVPDQLATLSFGYEGDKLVVRQ